MTEVEVVYQYNSEKERQNRSEKSVVLGRAKEGTAEPPSPFL
jgi:hypothetical protein